MSELQSDAVRTSALAIFERGWNLGDFSGMDTVFARPFRFHVGGTTRSMDLDELRAIVASWRGGFPDLRFLVHDVIAEDGMVALRATLVGTHLGTWKGLAPTGGHIEVDHMFVLRFVGGTVVEVWEVLDSSTLHRQLGMTEGGSARSPEDQDGVESRTR